MTLPELAAERLELVITARHNWSPYLRRLIEARADGSGADGLGVDSACWPEPWPWHDLGDEWEPPW